jgi:hypothetical protein
MGFFLGWPGLTHLTVTRSLDRVDDRVGFQNYGSKAFNFYLFILDMSFASIVFGKKIKRRVVY